MMSQNKKTSVFASIHLYGPSRYHCDQDGDHATIAVGEGWDATITAKAEDFLHLAKTCEEAARRIALRNFNKVRQLNQDELDKEFPLDDEN